MSDKIFIYSNDEKIELTGEAKDKFLADQKERNDIYEENLRKLEAEAKAKAEARAALLERLGITEEEAKLLLG